jgi:exodeoxyribonuclease VII small subunit
MTECSKQIFWIDIIAYTVLVIGAFGFWSLMSADASLRAEFRYSDFRFNQERTLHMAKQKFETAMKHLEDIVRELEGGDLSLEDALKKFEEGIKLSRFCANKLDEIEKKVSILVQNEEKKLDAQRLVSEAQENTNVD